MSHNTTNSQQIYKSDFFIIYIILLIDGYPNGFYNHWFIKRSVLIFILQIMPISQTTFLVVKPFFTGRSSRGTPLPSKFVFSPIGTSNGDSLGLLLIYLRWNE